jgi:hypothetical protein
MPSSTEPIAWVSEDGLHNIKAARERGASHYSVQVRIDRLDDYDTVPLYAGRAGATPDLTDEFDDGDDLLQYRLAPSGLGEHAHTWQDKPHRLIYDLISMVKAERHRAGATPDLTALRVAYRRLLSDLNADLPDTEPALDALIAAVAALVRSAQNDTDHG